MKMPLRVRLLAAMIGIVALYAALIVASGGILIDRIVYNAREGHLDVAVEPAHAMQVFVLVTLLAAAVAVVLSFLLSRWLSRPISLLAGGVAQVTRGNLSSRVADPSGCVRDEISDLAHSFNQMVSALQEHMRSLVLEKSRLRTVIDCMRQAVMVFDTELVLVLHNPAAMKLLKRTVTDEDGVPVGDAVEDPAFSQLIAEAWAHRKFLSQELRCRIGNQEGWILTNIVPFRDPDSGRYLGAVAVARDITEQKRLELLKAQFVNMVAHELRAPLAAIDSNLALIEGGYAEGPKKQAEVLTRSRKRLTALMDLVGDLLNLSRMEAGAVRREIGPQQPKAVLEDVAELMRPLAAGSGVCIELRLPESLPPVMADAEELKRLFTNLVNNAVKYNRPDGRVTITATRDGGYLRVCVEDTGIGIGEKGLARLFSEFFREKREETQRIPGTGLGLSIVKRIVDYYHGKIDVKSEVGKGSVFSVCLPCGGEAECELARPVHSATEGTTC